MYITSTWKNNKSLRIYKDMKSKSSTNEITKYNKDRYIEVLYT